MYCKPSLLIESHDFSYYTNKKETEIVKKKKETKLEALCWNFMVTL